MNNWINVLIVDDDRRYVTIQAENAAHHGINLIHCPYWDEAHKLIDGDPHKYDVIVLDGKGQINAASESEDINHLKKALKELYILEGKGIAIPYVVNTGYSESSAIGYDVKVFHKGTGEQQLFAYIQTLAKGSHAYRMRTKFPRIARAMEDGLLGGQSMALFLHTYGYIEEKRTFTYVALNPMRHLLEAFCMALAKIGMLPEDMAGDGKRRNLSACDYYLNGREGRLKTATNQSLVFKADPNPFPQRIATCFSFILANTNDGSHFNLDDECSPYLAKALFYALIELLDWLPGFVNEHPDRERNLRSILQVMG